MFIIYYCNCFIVTVAKFIKVSGSQNMFLKIRIFQSDNYILQSKGQILLIEKLPSS